MSAAKLENITRPSVWAMDNLVGNELLQLGIPDTILFHDGAPQVWLFTSKAGVVLKKRSLRKSSIKERFTRLSVGNPNNPQQRVVTVRFMDGTVRNLRRDSFKEMMTKFPATEPGIVCMQCFMQGKGSAGTVYRNSYKVTNDKGLVVTETSSFTTLTAEQAEMPVSAWNERDINLEKSKASGINKALDAVTLGVVRFLEVKQDKPTRILHLQCDYVVDIAGQIWLTWIGETTIAMAAAAQDLRLANVRDEGPRGRSEFLGSETALAMQREFGGPPALVTKSRRNNPRGHMTPSDNNYQYCEQVSKTVDRAAEAVELPRGVVGGGSGGIADALSRANAARVDGALESAMGLPSSALVLRTKQQGPREKTLSTMTVGIRASESAAWEAKGRAPGDKHYPSSFACAGDYCTIRVQVTNPGLGCFVVCVINL